MLGDLSSFSLQQWLPVRKYGGCCFAIVHEPEGLFSSLLHQSFKCNIIKATAHIYISFDLLLSCSLTYSSNKCFTVAFTSGAVSIF